MADEDGDDGHGEQDAAGGDADWHQSQKRVPAHVLHLQVETSPLVVERPAAGPAVGALELVLHVLPGVAAVAAPAASVALKKRREKPSLNLIILGRKQQLVNAPRLLRNRSAA